MNDLHSLPDNSMPEKTQSGFLFDDWNLPDEKGPINNAAPLFDGKIIARMPDLGSEGITQKIETPKFSAFWKQTCSAAFAVFPWAPYANLGTEQRLFRCIVDFGIIALLCGIGILLISQDQDKPTENVVDVAAVSADTTATNPTIVVSEPAADVKPAAETALKPETNLAAETAATPTAVPALEMKPVTETVAVPTAKPATETKLIAETAAKPATEAASPAIPVAPVENLIAASPPKQTSPWDRPGIDVFTTQEVVPTQPESPAPNGNGTAVGTVAAVPPDAVTMSPMIPIAAPSMPVPPYEMAVSPFELQMVTPSNVPPYHSAVLPGMMPMHGRQENVPGAVPQQNPTWQTSTPQQYLPPGHGQTAPINNPQGQSVRQPGQFVQQQQGQFAQQHGQFGQQGQQYVVPPGYMVPQYQAAPQNVPIPCDVSTLPSQGGPYMQPNGMIPMQNIQSQGMPVQRPPSDFYNAPPPYRQIY